MKISVLRWIYGIFSWKCSKCGDSIYNKHSNKKELSSCYLITPDKTIYEPLYDGYGVFGNFDIYELLGEGNRDLGLDRYFDSPSMMPFDIKVVHEQCFHKDSDDELKSSMICDKQGFFKKI